MAIQNMSGISSGYDWQKLIDLQIQQKSIHLNNLQQTKSDDSSKLTLWNSIEGAMGSLKSSADAIAKSSGFIAKFTTSSDSDKVALDASDTAVNGNHSILINQLARNNVQMHAGWIDSDTTAINTSGSDQVFSYSYKDITRNITIPNGTTLEGLVGLINSDSASVVLDEEETETNKNLGISASIVNDGTGGATAYHLVLSGNNTGGEYSITINDGATTLGGAGWQTSGFTVTQTSQNSKFRLDGIPPGSWIESITNDVSDAVPGLTFHLKAVTTETDPVYLTVAQDDGTIKNRIKNFVEAYNTVVQQLRNLSSYDTENKKAAALFGDANISSIKAELNFLVSSTFPGIPGGSNYTSLTAIGISPNTDGDLEIDNKKLSDALTRDPTNVANAFVFSTSTTNPNLKHLYHNDMTVGGNYAVVASYLGTGLLDSSGTNTIGGYPATIENGKTLVGKKGTPVEGLRISFSYPGGGAGSLSGTIRIGKGAAALFSDTLKRELDSDTGTTTSAKKTLNSEMDSLDTRIADEQKRIEEYRTMLQRKYQAAEEMISKIKNQMSSVTG